MQRCRGFFNQKQDLGAEAAPPAHEPAADGRAAIHM